MLSGSGRLVRRSSDFKRTNPRQARERGAASFYRLTKDEHYLEIPTRNLTHETRLLRQVSAFVLAIINELFAVEIIISADIPSNIQVATLIQRCEAICQEDVV